VVDPGGTVVEGGGGDAPDFGEEVVGGAGVVGEDGGLDEGFACGGRGVLLVFFILQF
jgi:hypothetical protein